MICPSCGGVVGRDCFNPQECAEITQAMLAQQMYPPPVDNSPNEDDFAAWRDRHLTLGEALTLVQKDGKSVAAAEVMLCQQAADHFDEMAEQIITPINSKARKILQDMALAIRQVVVKYRVMDERFPSMMDDMDRLARRRRLLERCASHLVGRLTGHSDACICEGCRLVAEIRAMDR